MKKELLRRIPKVDELLRAPALAALEAEAPALTAAVRAELEELRARVLDGGCDDLPDEGALCAAVTARVRRAGLPSLRPVVNGTGVVLHTNLGRACLSPQAAEAAQAAARSYSTLEYDVETGGRGLRYAHVESLLTELTGAESALVVNNNAAAVLLLLSATAAGGEVVVSRGELVEIGGSFRVPDIMEACGCRLREVGTTNKTHLFDYERAIGPETRALLRVHTSNFRIVGFTETVPMAELTALGRQRGLPVFEDLGSGALLDLTPFGVPDEPTAPAAVKAGADVVSFSGDKLLGGPQAGILVGKKQYIDLLKKHPLTRAMRVDKMTLAALEATLRSYRDGTAARDIPVLRMLGAPAAELCRRAELLCALLAEKGVSAETVQTEEQVGGGSAPTRLLPGWAVAVAPAGLTVDGLEEALRRRETPIIGRIARDRYLLDLRTLRDEDFPEIVRGLSECAR